MNCTNTNKPFQSSSQAVSTTSVGTGTESPAPFLKCSHATPEPKSTATRQSQDFERTSECAGPTEGPMSQRPTTGESASRGLFPVGLRLAAAFLAAGSRGSQLRGCGVRLDALGRKSHGPKDPSPYPRAAKWRNMWCNPNIGTERRRHAQRRGVRSVVREGRSCGFGPVAALAGPTSATTGFAPMGPSQLNQCALTCKSSTPPQKCGKKRRQASMCIGFCRGKR